MSPSIPSTPSIPSIPRTAASTPAKRAPRLFALALCGLGSLCASGCAQHQSYVQTDKAALGRVVVYRNGIAYYERRARVDGERLDLRVPSDKLDDFLKSLTVADARTGLALPVSFPAATTQTPDPSGNVHLTIQLPTQSAPASAAPREVVLTYVTDSPAWKPSYRVVVEPSGKVGLQGWAIVDNTSGEDWRAVRVGVGASSALSFRYDLHSIRSVHRETLRTEDSFAKAPPRGGSIYREEGQREVVLGDLADNDIPRQPGAPGGDALAALQKRERVTIGQSGGYARSAVARPSKAKAGSAMPSSPALAEEAYGAPAVNHQPAQDDARVRALAQALRSRRTPVVIEGFADSKESDAEARSLERANNLRNQLILQGVAPAQLQVNARGAVAGQRAGARVLQANEPAKPAAQAQAPKGKDDGAPVGESHFESSSPMTVIRGQSAMVSILQDKAVGDVVYLFDAESQSGDGRYAFRALRFRNPTTSTLESGPVTVYGEGRFIGEGLTESIPPGSQAVVPFALDRQVVVERETGTADHLARLMKLSRGALTAEVQHTRRTKLKVTNRAAVAAVVLVRHSVREGFRLLKSPKVVERFGEAHLFQVDLKAGETRVLEIEEATPMVRTLDLRAPLGLDMVRLYLSTAAPGKDDAFAEPLARLLKHHGDLTKADEAIESLRQRGDEYRVRLDELHNQIVSLQSVKAGGALLQHLQAKMKEISQRVQENTIAIVDQKEKSMVARVSFQETLSEVTLERREALAQKGN